MTTRYFDNAQIGIRVMNKTWQCWHRCALCKNNHFHFRWDTPYYILLCTANDAPFQCLWWCVGRPWLGHVGHIYVLHSCTTTTCEDDFMLTDASWHISGWKNALLLNCVVADLPSSRSLSFHDKVLPLHFMILLQLHLRPAGSCWSPRFILGNNRIL